MRVHFIRSGERRYAMRIDRASAPALVMDPAPGFDPDLPHDMVHFVAEALLGLKGGVFGQIAAGGDAGSFHIGAPEGADARTHCRAARKQAAKGAALMKGQGREGELSELAAFLFDIGWRSRTRSDSASQRAAVDEAARVRTTLSSDERARIDAVQVDVFAAFDTVSKAWRGLRCGEALVLEWPTLRRVDHPIG
ncbi:hypothetical protein AOA14_17150 [Sphingopyxis terrae subsp. terrae NBRC 15098]|uniref:Uncharacterized protein n=1 Tax=Sphingopyxis terrae subsp. terrae NBRC 15098 TaxID=1219058 RepID=A0A142W2N3_9SPHN|nr:hypothetical protein [Sphingopyxis terrae]AMU96330.1 hypothetical protein AOA14_17150 [Sphingopyxis terrae subsp. terrae NBRC 15098]